MSESKRGWVPEFSAETYQEFLNTLPIAYSVFEVLVDEDRNILDVICLYANKLMSVFMKMPIEELIGCSLLDDQPMGRKWLKTLYEAAYFNKSIHSIEYMPRSKRWTCVNLGPSEREGCCVITMEDVTTEHQNALNLSVLSKTDDLIIACAKCLNGNMSHEETIQMFLSIIEEAIQCDRLYILEEDDDGRYSMTFVRDKRLPPESDKEFQHMTHDDMLNWEEEFPGETSLEINDIEIIRTSNPVLYGKLVAMDIHSIYEVPLIDAGKRIGYFGAIGYGDVSSVDAKMLLETAGYFLTSEITQRKLLRELQEKSTHDLLCGVNNRNALENTVRGLAKEQRTVGILYADANGLKVINDTKGHKAGDAMLKNLSGILVDAFGVAHVYRAGGDEFVVVVPDMTQDAFMKLCEDVRGTFLAREDMAVALGWAWAKQSGMIMEVLHIADKAMYRDKADYYKHNDRRQRID
ncbi:MAG: sensor domain-containing diguanylate cyclase [Lachnospiraceae bacterium]|nr:sensor domain-containing diguanylate cyclase [Lachnospiraceae bacterium]